MASTPPVNMLAEIKDGINRAIKKQAEADFDLFIEDLKKRKESLVAGIVLNLSDHVRYDTSGHNLVIEIVKQSPNSSK